MGNINKIRKLSPTLNYLLNNLSNLPWSNITPDDFTVNYLSLTATAKFRDESITRKLFSKNEKLKNVYITFKPEGIIVTEKKSSKNHPSFIIKCNIELSRHNQVRFIPKHLEFNGSSVPTVVINKLIKNYNMEFELPKIPYNLKIVSLSTDNGQLIIKLRR